VTPAVRSAALDTGVTLPYTEQGDPSGVPVVFLHGVTDSRRSFDPVLPHLPSWIRALALTQRGHGDAERPVGGYRTSDFAADAAAFIRSLGRGPVVVVGHSMGGFNGQYTAIHHPDEVRGLVIAGSSPAFHDNPAAKEFRDDVVYGLEDPIDPAVARDFQMTTFARHVPPEFIELAIQESLKAPARVWKAAFESFMETDLRPDLGRIRCPTLVIWGDQDVFCSRAHQDAMVERIPDVRLVVYEGTGHAVHWEEPARFAAHVTAFVESVAGR
jgi:pimeloyl-ACP methyl ester carboxylesterase